MVSYVKDIALNACGFLYLLDMGDDNYELYTMCRQWDVATGVFDKMADKELFDKFKDSCKDCQMTINPTPMWLNRATRGEY